MDAHWITSPTGRRVLAHWADLRPAWLWTGDGRTLLWHNPSARLFGRRVRKAKPSGEAVPIKGQVARLIRLGAIGRTSLARLHFLVGGKPISETCAATPLTLPAGETGLLLVAVDRIEPELAESEWRADGLSEALFPGGSPYLVADHEGRIVDGSADALERAAPCFGPEDVLGDSATIAAGDARFAVTRFRASPDGARLMLLERIEIDVAPDKGETASGEPAAGKPAPVEAAPEEAALNEEDTEEASVEAPVTEEDGTSDAAPPPARLFRVRGRLFTPAAETKAEAEAEAEAKAREAHEAAAVGDAGPLPKEPAGAAAPADVETIERASRINFDELGRILADRIGLETREDNVASIDERGSDRGAAGTAPEASLVNLTGETFVLNRLPLGILVFRDQQVLFANRALLDLVGYDTMESLRRAGLPALFPAAEIVPAEAGPVTHMLHRDGTPLAVTARLQSVSWQRRPALLLSASAAETRLGHESAVRAFAEILAEARGEGFVMADRTGVVTLLSGQARAMLAEDGQAPGRPLTAYIERGDHEALKTFLERPARFAETARPAVSLHGLGRATEWLLFAEGQAGVVAGYFGLVRRLRATATRRPAASGDAEPALLNRVSRGIRSPLNTIVGFSDIIASTAFGPIDNPRYIEYARDIRTAGHEIAALVDELDDYARLRDGRYAPRPMEIDMAALLESCVVRVREQARRARVLVRSAISEQLPRVRADRASLGQAILNLMASAIDQTPPGGSVVLSAQRGEEGGVSVHVRDSSTRNGDPGERFVVFRDGLDRPGTAQVPVRSTMGLALTRSLLAVSTCSLSVDPAGDGGMLFSLAIPRELVVEE